MNRLRRWIVLASVSAAALGLGPTPACASVPATHAVMTAAQDTTDDVGVGPSVFGAPILASILRGVGVGALMGAAGLLALLAWVLPTGGPAPRRAATALAWVALVVLLLHLWAWLCDAAGSWHLEAGDWSLLTSTAPGRIEMARVGLALLTAVLATWGLRGGWAAGIGLLGLVASAGVGHAAAIATSWSLPLKTLHLWAGAIWLGGLLWLLLAQGDRSDHHVGVLRVSTAALIAVLAVTASGVATTLLFLPAVRDVVHSSYGGIALAKLGGVGVLVLFGAYHRFKLVPDAHAPDGAARLRRSVRYEIGVMCLVILLGGLLAYVSPPEAGM